MNRPFVGRREWVTMALFGLAGIGLAGEPVAETSPAHAPLVQSSGSNAFRGDLAAYRSERLAIVGRPVQNLQGQRLGEVDGVLVTADGKVAAIVMATGGLLGWGASRYEVPWSRVHWQRDGGYLTLDVGRQRVRAEFNALESD